MTIPLLNMDDKIQLVRQYMNDFNIDGWLIIDFRGTDPTGPALLGNLAPHSRLYAILITASGPITIIKSPVEGNELIDLHPSINTIDTLTQTAFMQAIRQQVKGFERIALNCGKNPQTDVLPAGRFIHLQQVLPKMNWETGENLMQIIHSVLTPAQMESHKHAAHTLTNIMGQTFDFIKDRIGSITEAQVANYMHDLLRKEKLTFLEGPMVAVQANAANPHYTPGNVRIRKNQILMIDLWAKWDIYADITHMAFTGSKVPTKIQTVWDTVLEARNTATAAIKPNIPASIPDELAREVIIAAGFEKEILHRTGHSIDTRSHGQGANLDSYEMPETRLLLPNTLTSVEPGIYLKGRFGIRSEINVAVTDTGHLVTTPPQENLLCL
ncbi:MAG: M24 family metallopeptidase [Promethearchaeota archaeon]